MLAESKVLLLLNDADKLCLAAEKVLRTDGLDTAALRISVQEFRLAQLDLEKSIEVELIELEKALTPKSIKEN